MHHILNQISLLLTYGGVVLSVFVTLLLQNRSVRGSRANLFLSVLLLAMAFSGVHLLFAGQLITHLSIRAYPLGDPTFFLIAPLLWCYVQELTGQRVGWSRRLTAHLIPFLFLTVGSVWLGYYGPAAPLRGQLIGFRHGLSLLFWGAVVTHFVGYLLAINRRWRTYQRWLPQEVSNTENVTVGWVSFFMRVFLGITVFFALVLLGQAHHHYVGGLNRLIALIFSLSILALGYKGILQQDVFSTIRQDVPTPPIHEGTDVPAPPKAIDPELVNRLLRYMADEKPYLNPELTLSELAKQVHLSRSELSQLINVGVGDNFYNFVNRYRVEQVQAFMCDPAYGHYNLLGLALEAGFKSKSTFNLIFKRFTGLTPGECAKTLRT